MRPSMRRLLLSVLTISSLLLASACNKADDPQATGGASAPAVTPAPVAPSPVTPVPDVGKLETETITAQGSGRTASEAVNEALRMAVLQVNGATMASEMVTVSVDGDWSTPPTDMSLHADEIAKAVYESSGGTVTNFKIIELQEPSLTSKVFRVTIEANVAKYKVPESSNLIKVVIGPINFPSERINIGGTTVSASEVEATLRERVMTALNQSGRFSVLDREMDYEIQQELDLIANGQASSAQTPKLSQAAVADLLWTATISDLAYHRHVRNLNTSNRDLVSYSGGWAATQKLINVTTRQIMSSDSLSGKAPSIAPTTLSSGINSNKVLNDMLDDLTGQVVASIIRATFPISIVSIDGNNVVLSQGGKALEQGARYEIVKLGDELFDPQTKASLGRTEFPCCYVNVTRVTPNLSYGVLEEVSVSLEGVQPGALQLRAQAPHQSKTPDTNDTTKPASNAGRGASRPAVTSHPVPAPVNPSDKKW